MSDPTRRALVVDDDSTNQLMLSMLLRRLSVSTESAGSVEQARQLLTGSKVDLVIVDYQLPDGTGLDVMSWLRAQTDNPSNKAVIMAVSGESGAEHESRCRDAGANLVMPKPVEIDRFRAEVGKVFTQPPQPAASIRPVSTPARAPSTDMSELWRLTRRRYVHDLMNNLLRARGAALVNPDNPLEATQAQVEQAIDLLVEYRDMIQLVEGDVHPAPSVIDLPMMIGKLEIDPSGKLCLDNLSEPICCDPDLLADYLYEVLSRALANDRHATLDLQAVADGVELIVHSPHQFLPAIADNRFPTHDRNQVEPGLVRCVLVADLLHAALRCESGPEGTRTVLRLPKVQPVAEE